MWTQGFTMVDAEDSVEAKTATYSDGVLLHFRVMGGSTTVTVTRDHARTLVEHIQRLIDSDFAGAAPADNVVTLQTGDAA